MFDGRGRVTREALNTDPAGSILSPRVVGMLAKLISVRGTLCRLRSYGDQEFVFAALLSWMIGQGIETVLIDPGKPWQNGTNESFNGQLRDERLAREWFRN
jgi:putative transposase